MSKYKIIAIVGESGCGKDFILKSFLSKYSNEYNKILNFTTRPIRQNEIDGVDYNFYSVQEVTQLLLNPGATIEVTCFNDWVYGTETSKLDIDKINIGIFSPEACEILRENPQIDLVVFYIKTKDKLRLIRQLNREESPDIDEIIRRYRADQLDFYHFIFNEVIHNDEDSKIDSIVDEVHYLAQCYFGQN